MGSDPERISKKGYDHNQWFQDKEQSDLRKMVKKKFFRKVTSVHYTKERSVLEEIILGTYQPLARPSGVTSSRGSGVTSYYVRQPSVVNFLIY